MLAWTTAPDATGGLTFREVLQPAPLPHDVDRTHGDDQANVPFAWVRLRAYERAARTRSPQRVEHHCRRPWVFSRNLEHGSASHCASR